MIQAPCKNCKERFVGCHTVCEMYINYKEVHNEEKKQIDWEREKEAMQIDRSNDAIKRFVQKKARPSNGIKLY